jgi:CDP-4-dehydro-6-deoxyglucose reductase, E3
MTHRITVQPSGQSFPIKEGESILDAALAHGHNFPYGCRGGFCGDCRGRVLSGTFAYPDGFVPASIDPDEAARGHALLCKAVASSDLTLFVRETASGQELPVRTLELEVSYLEHLSPDVVRLLLKLPEGEGLRYLAGQYLEIRLADGRKRAFSIASAPHNQETIELHLRHIAGGAFTDHVFGDMGVGERLTIEGPRGQFYLREGSDHHILLVAGGTGFAPIKAIIEHAFEEGCKRPMHLYWGARDRSDLYLHELAEEWAASHANFSYTPVLSMPSAEAAWQGRTGFVHEAVLFDYADLSGHDIYMAGPPPMIDGGRRAFAERGVSAERMFFDAFEIAGAAEKR